MNKIIVYIIALFSIIGGVDKLFGNKLGLGKKFEEGILSMGGMALSIIGIYSFAPVIANVISPIISPLYKLIGADPSIFTSSILACDMGGYAAALELASSHEIALFSGLILASAMGAAVVFTIPVGMGIIEEKDKPYFAKGILLGIITIPIGCFAGGIAQGLPHTVVLINLLPVILLAVLLSIGIIYIPKIMMKGFSYLSKGIGIIGTIGLVSSIFEALTGMAIIPGLLPIEETSKVAVIVSIMLSGAYPMIYIITKAFQRPFKYVGKKIKINDSSIAGLFASLASNIPMFFIMKDMDKRGKVINCAFGVGGAFVFGGQFGFVAGVEKSMIMPFIISKFVGGFCAILLAYIVTGREETIDGRN